MSKRRIIVLALIGVTAIVGSRVFYWRFNDLQDDIREAVFRYEVDRRSKAGSRTVHYLALGASADRDPSDRFMKRFQRYDGSVKKVSASTGYGSPEVRDAETGRWGAILFVESVRWTGANQVAVKGGVYGGQRAVRWNVYQVVKRGDRWYVTRVDMYMVS